MSHRSQSTRVLPLSTALVSALAPSATPKRGSLAESLSPGKRGSTADAPSGSRARGVGTGTSALGAGGRLVLDVTDYELGSIIGRGGCVTGTLHAAPVCPLPGPYLSPPAHLHAAACCC